MLSAAMSFVKRIVPKFARITGNTERNDSANPSVNHNARKAHQARLRFRIWLLRACPEHAYIIHQSELTKADNGSDHRAGTMILQAEKHARKPGFACITLLFAAFGLVYRFKQHMWDHSWMSHSFVIILRNYYVFNTDNDHRGAILRCNQFALTWQ